MQLGYARQDSVTGHYRLTLKMFELSSGIVNSMDIMGVAKLHLERLAQRTGEAVHLVIRDARDIVYIYKTESGPSRMSSRVGLRSPLYCTGVGKAILSTLPRAEVEEIWRQSQPRKLTEHTITDLNGLLSQLAQVRTAATPSTTRRTSRASAVWRWPYRGRAAGRTAPFPSAAWRPT